MAAAYDVFSRAGIYQRMIKCLILGDDNLSVFRGPFKYKDFGQLTQLEGYAQMVQTYFAELGLNAKVKFTNHYAKAEFCNMVFVKALDSDGAQTFTMIAKLGRIMTKFNKVKKSAITTTTRSYVYDNLYAIRNTLQFYPGLKCYHKYLYDNKGLTPARNSKICPFKTPKILLTPDNYEIDEFMMNRYGYLSCNLETDVDLIKAGSVSVPWFDAIAQVDLQ